MANAQGFVAAILMLLVFTATGDRILTREELAPLLSKEVIIPNTEPPPQATPWPEEFTIKFTTDNGMAPGVLIYDWANRQQAIVHGQGASHCKARGSNKGFCYILENPIGTFEIDPVAQECELTNPGIGTVPPTWVTRGVFVGVEEVKGAMCNRFDYPPSMHSWLERVDGGLPCAFLFSNQNLSYFFDVGSLKLGQPSLSTFRIPEYCAPVSKADQ
jgi:hypothetical protein